MRRRGFLTAAAGAVLATFASSARAAPSLVRAISRDERGITVSMWLEHAPFPSAGAPYTDASVLVFVPHYLRVSPGERISALVHFHGHNTTAERALEAHALREQLYESRQNAILVVPQGPTMAADSSPGKLAASGGLRRLLAEVLDVLDFIALETRSRPTAIRPGIRLDTVCLSAHSGGYHAAASCVLAGGIEINEVYLFDALYGDTAAFRDWVVSRRGHSMRTRHKLVSYYDESMRTESEQLLLDLERSGVVCASEQEEGTLSRGEISRSEAVFIRTTVPHRAVTRELNALRDCLCASGLTRHVRTAWLDQDEGNRPLERRR